MTGNRSSSEQPPVAEEDLPRELDATPSDGDLAYGSAFLERAGHLDGAEERETAYAPGHDVRYVASLAGRYRLAYLEFSTADLPRSTLAVVARALARRTRLRYVWIADPETGRVEVYRTVPSPRRFTYDPVRQRDETAQRRAATLDRAAADLDAPFDCGETVDRFIDRLRTHRTALAAATETRSESTLAEPAAALAAQRAIDRLCFLRFLDAAGLLVAPDGPARRPPGDSDPVASLVRGSDDVFATLRRLLVDGSRRTGNESGPPPDPVRIAGPALPAGLFHAAPLAAQGGGTVAEEDVAVDGFDWTALVGDLQAFDWRLDGFAGGDPSGETAGVLTPSVLGAVHETLTLPLRDHDDAGTVDSSASRSDPQSAGNAAVGAYYTDEPVTDFLVRRALWEALREAIEADTDDRLPDALDPDDLYRPGTDRRADVEAAQRDGFDVLYEAHRTEPGVLDYVDSKLRDLTVCDPAVGAGEFALAVANALFEWRTLCAPDRSPVAIRREIGARNVFGVDRLAGATTVCRRRLHLWILAGAAEPGPGRRTNECDADSTPPMPDLRGTFVTGNSLVGFTDRSATGSESPDTEGFPAADAASRMAFDERFAAALTDPETGTPLQLPHRVDDPAAARRSLATAPDARSVLVVSVPAGLPDALDAGLRDLDFTTYTYRARLDGSSLDDGTLERLFALLDGHVAADDREVLVERGYAAADFATDRLDACHWPLEFPGVFDDGGFDVVLGNPPFGAAVGPEATPILADSGEYACQGTRDTCEWFYERAFDLVHDDGVVAFVASKSLAFYGSWADLREKLLADTAIVHVFDVGLGFDDVTLETIAMVHALGDDGDGTAPAIHHSRDRRAETDNRPVHLGWADQRVMREAGTILFRPVTDAQRDVLDRILARDRRLGDVASGEITRQLYVPDATKRTLPPGDDPFVDRNRWVGAYALDDVRHWDLSEYAEAVEAYAVPRVMLKVLRGSRLRAWLDPDGDLVGTEKLVNVPLADHDAESIAVVYAALNHPCASFYLQTAVFSGTTETARVMDAQYSAGIPLPAPPPAVEDAIARLAWGLTIATQLTRDGVVDLTNEAEHLQHGLEATVAGCYLGGHDDLLARWTAHLSRDGPPHDEVRDCFEAFYVARYTTADGSVEGIRDGLTDAVTALAAVTSEWDADAVLDSDAMRVVRSAL